MRHEYLATGHTMAEVAVTAMVKFTVMIQKVTPVTLFTASRKMASVLLAGVSLFASGRWVGIQGRTYSSFLNAQSSPDSAQVSASYFSDQDPTLH